MARVIAGLQDLEEGTRLRPGVVTYHRPPDVEHHRLDLRTTNLVVTTRGGINLRRPTRTPSRGVQRRGQRYRAQIKLGGQERVLDLYETSDAAAQAREAELLRLGLHDIARLQTERVTQEGALSTTGNKGRLDGHEGKCTQSQGEQEKEGPTGPWGGRMPRSRTASRAGRGMLPPFSGDASFGEYRRQLVRFAAVFDPLHQVLAGKAPFAAHPGRGDFSFAGEVIDGTGRDPQEHGGAFHIENILVHRSNALPPGPGR
jgi:hypothetical protein